MTTLAELRKKETLDSQIANNHQSEHLDPIYQVKAPVDYGST